MKKIEYLQFEYGGNFYNRTLNLPDDCTMHEICNDMIFHYKDDIWSTSYLIISSEEFDNSDLVGNVYTTTINGVVIKNSEVPILSMDKAPKFEKIYSVQYCYPERKEIMDILGKDITKECFKELEKLYYKIESILLLRNFTSIGLSVTKLTLRDYYTGKEESGLTVENIEYNALYNLKCTDDPQTHKMFLKESEKVYKYLINK